MKNKHIIRDITDLSETGKEFVFSKLKKIKEDLAEIGAIFEEGAITSKIQDAIWEVIRIENRIRDINKPKDNKRYKDKEWLYGWYWGHPYLGFGGEGLEPEQGKSAKWVARRAKCSEATIYRYLKKFGISTRRQYEEETKYGI